MRPTSSRPLGISQGARSEACGNRGRYHAAVPVAVIAEKHQAQQLQSPGGYLRGLVARDRSGRLNLDHSLFALRDRADRLRASQNVSRGCARAPVRRREIERSTNRVVGLSARKQEIG